MRTIKLKDDECPAGGSAGVDWKAPPMAVLEEVDQLLTDVGMEIVVLETGDDTIVFNIELREEP